MVKREVDVAGGGGNGTMPQQVLDDGKRRAIFQEVGGEGVSEAVGGDRLCQPRAGGGHTTNLLKGRRTERDVRCPTGEEQDGWAKDVPVGSEHGQEFFREHDHAIDAAFALVDEEALVFGVNVLNAEMKKFGQTQTAGVGGHKRGAVFEGWDSG